MKSDPYTKAVLTVIAFCLFYVVVKDVSLVPHAQAQTSSPIDVNIVQIDGKRFGPLDVSVLHPALPVKVQIQ